MAISVIDVSGSRGNSRSSGGNGAYNIRGQGHNRYNKQDNAYSPESTIFFPNKKLLFVDDSIELSKEDLADNSQGGLAEAVFFSYSNLHEILSSYNRENGQNTVGLAPFIEEMGLQQNNANEAEGPWMLNSRVVSASLGRGRHIELSHPVTIELRHINEENMTDPVCVFWDYEAHGWSGSGCQLKSTNSSITTCQCDHLTSFAVLMRPVDDSIVKNSMGLMKP